MEIVVADGTNLTLDQFEAVARTGATIKLTDDPETRRRIDESHDLNLRLVASGQPVYGVTTGPGKAVSRQVGTDRAAKLQANFVKFLGCGVGEYLPVEECRAALLARINCLARGYSGVRIELISRLIDLLNRDVIPCIPAIGSVGASGDLVPASYIAAVLTGDREVYVGDQVRPAADVYREIGLEPLTLEPKEGLALVNGTNIMTGVGILAVEDAHRLGVVADGCTALAVEVLTGIAGPYDAFFHQLAKPHPGQIQSADRIRRLLVKSALVRDYKEMVADLGTLETGVRELPVSIQDSYSIRCAPHCIGALHDAVEWVRGTLFVELNSSNDNPLYDIDAKEVRSGGNFSGFHVGLAMDTLKIAVASVADLLDRQFALLNDEAFNRGLGMCCTDPLPDDHPEAGLHYGFKGAQLVISALTAEALNACTPMTVFSRSTACHVQDKVSMAATAARQTREILGLSQKAAAIHLLILAQAADLRGPEKLGRGSRAIHDSIRAVSAHVDRDRELDEDIARVAALVETGELAGVIDAI